MLEIYTSTRNPRFICFIHKSHPHVELDGFLYVDVHVNCSSESKTQLSDLFLTHVPSSAGTYSCPATIINSFATQLSNI